MVHESQEYLKQYIQATVSRISQQNYSIQSNTLYNMCFLLLIEVFKALKIL